MAEQWEKSVSLQKSERAHSICPEEEVSLLALTKKETLQQPRMVHACVVSAQAIQKVKRLKAQVETFFITRSSTHSSMTQQTMCLIVGGGM